MKKNLFILLFISAIFFNMFNVLAVDNVDYNSDDLTLGAFFSVNYPDGVKVIDKRIGLYTTSTGSSFDYIGETGLTGRDARIVYLNGVFYLTATKGGTSSGGYVFNVFKSTDLINWTDDTSFPYVYRYDIDVSVNNKYGLPTNNWGPKWFVDNGKLYLAISSTRFDENGSKYYYIKGDQLAANNVIYDSNLTVNTKKGVLVKESPVLNDNNRAQYLIGDTVYYTRDDNNNIYNMNNEKLVYDGKGKYTDSSNNCVLDVRNSNKLTCNDTKVGNLTIKTKIEAVLLDEKLQQIKCPWYDYPLFDIFISEVDLGTVENQRDINYQNLVFKGFYKVNLSGYSTDIASDNFKGYAYRHGVLAGPIVRNDSNTGYKYAMFLKSDPYGTVQRWVSNDLFGEWKQVDDRFYPSSYETIEGSDGKLSYIIPGSNENDKYVCKSVSKVVKHDESSLNPITVSGDNTYGISKHFEGSFFETFNGQTYFYSDHYSASSEVKADTSGDSSEIKKLNHYGIYYSILNPNNGQSTDFTYVGDHLRFNIFRKVDVQNASMKPSDLTNNSIRNGCVYRADNDVNTFKTIVLNASKFNLSYKIYSTSDDSKVIAVIKSNRAIRNNGSEQWSIDGWKYVTELNDDLNVKNLNNDLVDKFSKFEVSVPFTARELYLYKVIDKNSEIDLTVFDRNGESKTIYVNLNDSQVIDVEVDDGTDDNKDDDFIDVDVDDDDEVEDDENIDDTEEQTEIKSEDSIDDVDVASTGSNISLILLIFGVVLIVSGLVLFPFALKKKNN